MKKSELRKLIREEIKSLIQESTRSRVGIKDKSGKIKSVYVHFDGGLNYVGSDLKKYYKDPSKVKQLIDLGNLSILGKEIGEKQDFNKPHKGWTLAYDRDRGETGQKPIISKDEDGFITDAKSSGGEFAYYYDLADKSWYYTKTSGGSTNAEFQKL